MLLAQQFKHHLLQAVNNYMAKYNDKKPMSLKRSKEVARFIHLLDTVQNPLELYKKAMREYEALILSWAERVLGISRSGLKKELKDVFEFFSYSNLLDEQVQELMKQVKVNAELEQENVKFKAELASLKDKLAKAEIRIKDLEEENAKLKAQLQGLDSNEQLSESKTDNPLQQKLLEATQTIQVLECRVHLLESEQEALKSQNVQLRKNNQVLCEKNLRLIKDKHELRQEVVEAAARTPGTAPASINRFKLGT